MEAFTNTTYGPPSVLELSEVDRPTPGKKEILVRVLGLSINPADWRLMRGDPKLVRLESGLFKPRRPILGADLSGRVEAVGAKVTEFEPGDEVFGDISRGAFASYAIAKANQIAPKPKNLSFEEAAAVPLAGLTALQALRDKGRVKEGQRVLINGASGGVGTYAVQIARTLGAEVTGVCSTRNVALVKSLGATRVVDYTKKDFTESDISYDVILDAVGNLTLSAYRRALAPGGIGVVIGFKSLKKLLGVVLSGSLALREGRKIAPMNASANRADLNVLREMIENGDIAPVVDRRYPFHELPQAIEYLEAGRTRGKVTLYTS